MVYYNVLLICTTLRCIALHYTTPPHNVLHFTLIHFASIHFNTIRHIGAAQTASKGAVHRHRHPSRRRSGRSILHHRQVLFRSKRNSRWDFFKAYLTEISCHFGVWKRYVSFSLWVLRYSIYRSPQHCPMLCCVGHKEISVVRTSNTERYLSFHRSCWSASKPFSFFSLHFSNVACAFIIFSWLLH